MCTKLLVLDRTRSLRSLALASLADRLFQLNTKRVLAWQADVSAPLVPERLGKDEERLVLLGSDQAVLKVHFQVCLTVEKDPDDIELSFVAGAVSSKLNVE